MFRVYKYDEVDAGLRRYAFSLNEYCGEEECQCDARGKCPWVFDVRDLPNWAVPDHPPFLVEADNTAENRAAWGRYAEARVEEEHIERTIREALDGGLLVPGEPLRKRRGRRIRARGKEEANDIE